MPRCSVIVCKSTSCNVNYTIDGISFHTYPKDPVIKEKWMIAAGRGPEWFPTKNSTICSCHFEQKCFQPQARVRRLYEWAVPTLKLRSILTDYYTEPSTSEPDQTQENINNDDDSDDDDITNLDNVLVKSEKNENDETPQKEQTELRHIIAAQQHVIKRQKIRIKSLKTKNRRYSKNIEKLKSIVAKLKEKNECIKLGLTEGTDK